MGEPDLVEALDQGKAFADLSSWWKISVSGADALDWLNDLVSADLADLAPGRARSALLLRPTGRVRAHFTVAAPGGSIVLLQEASQPERIDDILAPYVLSSDVRLEDRTEDLSLLAFPGLERPPQAPGASSSAPSVLGSGVDLIGLEEDRARLVPVLSRVYAQAGGDDVERWRVATGRPRFGVDGSGEDLPVEAGMDQLVSYGKGCFLGQEAVAKVRNLGHPRRLVLPLRALEPVAPGDVVLTDGREAGRVTSAVPGREGTAVLARVDWDARSGPWRTAAGIELAGRT